MREASGKSVCRRSRRRLSARTEHQRDRRREVGRRRALHVGRGDGLHRGTIPLRVVGAHRFHLVERQIPREAFARAAVHRVAADEIAPGAGELRVWDRLALDALDLGQQRLLGLGRGLGRRAQIEHDHAGLLHGLVEGRRGVRERALVTQLDEQSACHAAAEHAREDFDRRVVAVVERRREPAHEDLRLLRGLIDHAAPRRRDRRRTRAVEHRRAAGRHRAEETLRLGEHVVHGHLPAHGQHDAIGAIEGAIAADDRGVVEARERGGRAESRQRVRMRPVDERIELVEGVRGRVVVPALQAGQHEVALAIDLLRRELRLQRQLRREPQQLAPEAGERGGADLRIVRLGRGADLSAERGHRVRELGAAAPRGALHHHRVGEVRQPGRLGRLPARPHPNQQ